MKILVLFKTHLDVGFTDLSQTVVNKYNNQFIPSAISVGEQLALEDTTDKLVWTTGSWLIWQYWKQANEEEKLRLEKAIRAGIIRWHGLPFTTHSEVMNRDLFCYGISMAKELDSLFGVKTIAAKMTDVPGHTRGIVPLLAEAGVEFLHIGVNAGATAPDVPDIFRWQTPQGQEITVMYNKGYYGEFSKIEGTDVALYFAHTNDNMGPPTLKEVHDTFSKLRKEHPDAEIVAADLNDLAIALRPICESLPVVKQEIGDTWIHGAGTDPQKVSEYRALLRLAPELEEEERQRLYSKLIMIPEHTWGLNENEWLRDYENYTREHFEAVRNQEAYCKMEQSWAEQRNYISQAIECMEKEENRKKAIRAIEGCNPARPDFSIMTKIEGNDVVLNGWEIGWDADGGISKLRNHECIFADSQHRIGAFEYEVYSEDEIDGFMNRYIKPDFMSVAWVVEDNGKPGLRKEQKEYRHFKAKLQAAYCDEKGLYLLMEGDSEANVMFGCPMDMILHLIPKETEVELEYSWYDKPANRIPEGLWLHFGLLKPLTSISKLGHEIDPCDVISCGNRELHATDGILKFEEYVLETLDAPVLAVGEPRLYGFYNEIPDTANGVWVNLFNNQWGTNFPMWNEGNAKFRFVIRTIEKETTI